MAYMQVRDDEGRKVLNLTIAAGGDQPEMPPGYTIEPADETPLWQPVPETISDRQFAQVLALAGTITQDEALAWAARGDLPKRMVDAIAKIPEAGNRRFDARMRVAGDKEFSRHHPVTDQLGALLGYDAVALDALWTRAAAL